MLSHHRESRAEASVFSPGRKRVLARLSLRVCVLIASEPNVPRPTRPRPPSRCNRTLLEDLMTASARRTPDKAGRHGRQRAGLNRGILAETRNSFANKLSYKMEERCGRVVDPAYTSQTCGVVDPRSPESQAIFCGIACEHRDPADVHAAANIPRCWNTAHQPVGRSPRRLGKRELKRGTLRLESPQCSRQGRCLIGRKCSFAKFGSGQP